MPLLLNIDTATGNAGVCISRNDEMLAMENSTDQKNHAAFIHPAITTLMQVTGFSLHDIDAVAVTAGPGSYTGLRVGIATAKGLCYVLKKPLILVNTLEVMALASIEERRQIPDNGFGTSSADNLMHAGNTLYLSDNFLFCPMIDARRMEVFTAVYNYNLEAVVLPAAMILDENSFKEQLNAHTIIFSGNGSSKFKNIQQHTNAVFTDVRHHAGNLAKLASKAFAKKEFADIAYSGPFYLKEFFSAVPKVL
ncbi:MAG TPA: tRNA (adenosine(37)-N6)-threonylcarbamoyltransferase complex dimerization subunit type 1 TsaB [Panacibacter sp.]|nr:tRNA (adenosine(37)-N6)-threonylcarbamoyltransferase complex dimerization subunit type 1 TsaB [Panacibacter sp.]